VVDLAARSRAFGVEPALVAFGEDGPVRAWAESAGLPVTSLGAGARHEARGRPAAGARAVRRRGGPRPRPRSLAQRRGGACPRAADPGTGHLPSARAPRRTEEGGGPPRRPPQQRARRLRRGGADRARGWVPAGTPVVTIGNGVALAGPASPEQRARARARMGLPAARSRWATSDACTPRRGRTSWSRRWSAGSGASRGPSGPRRQGSARSALREAAAPLGARAHLLGEVVDGAAELLAGLDVYAQPSRREGRSVAMLEAMAAALPTVAHGLPAVTELHPDGTTRCSSRRRT
jgi:hypothetical protein